MKKYFIKQESSDKTDEVKIHSDKNASLNEREFQYECKFINENTMILRINNENYFLSVSENEESNLLDINIESKIYKVSCRSELEMMIDKMSGNKTGSKIRKEIHSPMPGIIKSINVKEGERINKGDVIMVLEAMKMENEIKASRECVIKKLNVDVMSSVEKNELLIILE